MKIYENFMGYGFRVYDFVKIAVSSKTTNNISGK